MGKAIYLDNCLLNRMSSACRPANEVSRVKRSKAEAAKTYDMLSSVYDLLSAGVEWKWTEIGIQMLRVRENENVLEIGFGTGKALMTLAQAAGHGGGVYGVDISRGMIETTRERVRSAHLDSVVDLIAGDGTWLPLKSESVDAVFMSFVLELFDSPEIPVVLAESLRVLRRGGRLCVVALSTEGRRGSIRRMYEWTHGHFPRYADCRPICIGDFLHGAGFEISTSELHSMWGLSVGVVLGEKLWFEH